MGIEELFALEKSRWKEHCKQVSHSSNPLSYTNCEPYREIVSMGEEALPLILRAYSGNPDEAFFSINGWMSAVKEIVGEKFVLPNEYRGDVLRIREYTIKWLREYLKLCDFHSKPD